jgi:uncharacterized membrane protein YgcG
MRPIGAASVLGVVLLSAVPWMASCGTSPPSTDSAWERRAQLLDDGAAFLGPDEARRIRAYLAWVQERYGIDYHVVIAEAGNASLEEHAHALFTERGAHAISGSGLLLLVDPAAQAARVEVGYALEPYVTDAEASRMLSEYVRPRTADGMTPASIEAAIEALVEELRPHLETAAGSGAAVPTAKAGTQTEAPRADERLAVEAVPLSDSFPSGGGGANLDLHDLPIERLDTAARGRLREVVVPQPDPRRARDLEIALLHRGIYFQEGSLYDAAWRSAARTSGFAPSRLREIARQVDRPYEVVTEGDRAVAYCPDADAVGPVFLRRETTGWIIDASAGARSIVYDYGNDGWYARDDGSPYLPLLLRALPLRRVALAGGGAAWTR